MSAADQALELVFARIEAAAVAGDRCPQNDELQNALAAAGHRALTAQSVIAQLAKEGRVRGGVYGKNWRRLWITAGPNKGKATAPCPHKSTRPHMIYDHFGVSRARRF